MSLSGGTLQLATTMYLYYRYNYTGTVEFFKPKNSKHGGLSTAVALKVANTTDIDAIEISRSLCGFLNYLIQKENGGKY